MKTLGWRKEDFEWYAKCEKYQRQLVKQRWKENLPGAMTFAAPVPMQHLDYLFDPWPIPKDYQVLRFVGENGKFKPGKMAAVKKTKLPADAIEIVEQLLIWMPNDLRLYWLLGELLNAKGDVESAQIVFRELFSKYLQAKPEFQSKSGIINDPQVLKELVKEFTQRFVKEFPEISGHYLALIEYVPPIAEIVRPGAAAKTPEPPTPPNDTKPDTPDVAPLKVDLQALGVGLVAGGVVGFLIAWRVRDVLRRRASAGAPRVDSR